MWLELVTIEQIINYWSLELCFGVKNVMTGVIKESYTDYQSNWGNQLSKIYTIISVRS